MTHASTSTSADVLRGLGLEVLVQVLEQSGYGVCVTGPEHEWVYLNPAGARLVGAPFEQLRGRPYLDSFPVHERDALLALEMDQREGDTGFYSNTIVRPDGTEREMTWSGTVVTVDGAEMAPAFFHDTTAVAKARREAEVLAGAAAGVAAGGDTAGVLDALTRAAVATTRGTACLLLVEEAGAGAGGLRLRGRSVEAAGLAAAVALTGARLGDLPGAGLLRRGRPVHLADHRHRLLGHDRWADVVRSLTDVPWRGSALLPVRVGGEVVGELLVTLPPEVTGPTEPEVAFWASLADQAAAALAEEELRRRTRRLAELDERRRLGRDLHDSVSQSLFVLRQRAELVERALSRGDSGLAAGAAAGLREVAESALADMRALLDELRPAEAADRADTEDPPDTTDPASGSAAVRRHDLGERLQALAATVTARDGLPVRLDVGPGGADPALPADMVTHVVRLVGEALHNVVKHAAARHAVVTVRLERPDSDVPALVVTTTDDGRGCDPRAPAVGHGRRAMAERAQACGGSLQVTSGAGTGTTVGLRVPLPSR